MDKYSVMIVFIILYNQWPMQTIEYSPTYDTKEKAISYAIKKCNYHYELGCLWCKSYLLKNNVKYKYIHIPKKKKKRCCNCNIL